MKKIINRFKRIDFSNLYSMVSEISDITNKSKIAVFIDMTRCYKKYGAGYSEYHEYEYYLLNDAERETFMTSTMANKIVLKYNQKEFRHLFYDKSNFNQTFDKYIGRDWIDIRTVDQQTAKEFLNDQQTIMIKETKNLMGHGVERVVANEVDDFSTFHEKAMEKKQYLWEEFFIQNSKMSKLHEQSVNTLRVITFYDGKDVHILEKIIKIGNGGHLDNFGAGGMYTILDEDWKIKYPAFDGQGRTFKVHPISNEELVGFQVPMHDEVSTMINQAAKVIPEIPYVGWDVAIGENGPVLIEGNYNSGVFQMKPSITGKKKGLKPLYERYIDF